MTEPTPSKPAITIREMTIDDIDQVVELDRKSFATPWPARTYRYEVNNKRSCMIVLEAAGAGIASQRGKSGFSQLLNRLTANGKAPPQIVGYSGFWHIADEAHISTIAVDPDWRGKNLGELLLWGMIREGVRLGAEKVTLEVRVSNDVAKNLYYKYSFAIIGKRRGYYRDNREDADLMQVGPITTEYRKRLVAFGRALGEKLEINDQMHSNLPQTQVGAD